MKNCLAGQLRRFENLLFPSEIARCPAFGPLQGADFIHDRLPFGHEVDDFTVDGRQSGSEFFKVHEGVKTLPIGAIR